MGKGQTTKDGSKKDDVSFEKRVQGSDSSNGDQSQPEAPSVAAAATSLTVAGQDQNGGGRDSLNELADLIGKLETNPEISLTTTLVPSSTKTAATKEQNKAENDSQNERQEDDVKGKESVADCHALESKAVVKETGDDDSIADGKVIRMVHVNGEGGGGSGSSKRSTMVVQVDPESKDVKVLDLLDGDAATGLNGADDDEEGEDEAVGISPRHQPILEKLVEENSQFLLDIQAPEGFARDVTEAAFKLSLPKFQTFGAAIEFIFHNGDFFERLCSLFRYDCMVTLFRCQEQLIADWEDEKIMRHVRHFRWYGGGGGDGAAALAASGNMVSTVKALQILYELIDGQARDGEDIEMVRVRNDKDICEFVTALGRWLQTKMDVVSDSGIDLASKAMTPLADLKLLKNYLPELDSYCHQMFLEATVQMEHGNYAVAVCRFRDAAFAAIARKNKSGEKGGSKNILGKYNTLLNPGNDDDECDDVGTYATDDCYDDHDHCDEDDDDCFDEDKLYEEFDEFDSESEMVHLPLESYEDTDDGETLEGETDDDDDEEETAAAILSRMRRTEEELMELPCEHDLIWLEVMTRYIECLLRNEELRTASMTASLLLRWMTSFRSNSEADSGPDSTYAALYYSRFRLILAYFCDAEERTRCHKALIRGVNQAIESYLNLAPSVPFDVNLFITRLKFMYMKADWLEKSGDLSVVDKFALLEDAKDIYREEEHAKIIVDPKIAKAATLPHKRLAVPSLTAALKVAKDGDLIFLYEGVHNLNGDPTRCTVLNKSISVVGCHPVRCTVTGSFYKINPNSNVLFSRLTMVLGGEPQAQLNYGLNLQEGSVTFKDCYIKQTHDNAIAVAGKLIQDPAKVANAPKVELNLHHCNIDSGEKRAFIVLHGERGDVCVDSCLVTKVCMFITTSGLDRRNGMINVTDTTMLDVQYGVKILVHHQSQMESHVRGCHFRLKNFDPDLACIGVCQTGGVARINQNFFQLGADAANWETGVSLHSVSSATVSTNRIESSDSINRTWLVSNGIMLSENQRCDVNCNEVVGMRIGIKVTNELKDEVNNLRINECSMRACSIGVSVDDNHYGGETEHSGRKSAEEEHACGGLHRSPVTPRVLTQDGHLCGGAACAHAAAGGRSSQVNLKIELSQCNFDTCYYGVMNQSGKTRLLVESNTFDDVPKAVIIIYRNLGYATALRRNEYRVTRVYREAANEAKNKSKKSLYCFRNLVYTRFALSENLPCRISYEKANYTVITFREDEQRYIKRFTVSRR